jgi:arylsulfatase
VARSSRRVALAAFGAGLGVAAAAGTAAWLAGGREARTRSVPSLPPLPARQRPPNILLVVTDQERADLPQALPLPGHERLRERGTFFANWHVHTTPCSPSRSNLYFGRHTQHTGMHVNLGLYPEPQLPAALPSLGHYLRANGYHTAYKGKWHLSELRAHYELTYGAYPSSRDALEPFGFSDYNFDGDPHGATWTGWKVDGQIASESARWLHERGRPLSDAGRPWLLAVNFVNPHDVMYVSVGEAQHKGRRHPDYLAPLAPPPLDPLYAQRWGLPLPANRGDDLSRKPWAHANYRDFCDMAFGPVPADEASWQAYQDYYFNCIRDADRHLMTVLDALEGSGQAGRTVVVFTADHGEMAGAHGLRQKGPFLYQENTRVPFIVRHPDVHGGARTEALGGAVDLIPTLLQFAGADAARVRETYPELVGAGLAEAVANPAARTVRDARGHLYNYNTTHYLDSEFAGALAGAGVPADRYMPLRALAAGLRPLPRLSHPALFRGVHTGRHKFARYFAPSAHHRPRDWDTLVGHNQLELYDLHADPLELHNLAHEPARADATTRALILALNERLDALVQEEVGEDLGADLPGPGWLARL